MDYDAIFNNDIVLPNEMGKIINKTTSAYLEKTEKPMRLHNRKKFCYSKYNRYAQYVNM